MFSSLQYSSSYDTMYPPPGSFKYHTPKPVRNGEVYHKSDDEINCDKPIAIFKWCSALPCFRLKFWKIIIMIILVIVTIQFSTVITVKRVTEPLFVVKDASKTPNSIYKTTKNSSSHRTAKYMNLNAFRKFLNENRKGNYSRGHLYSEVKKSLEKSSSNKKNSSSINYQRTEENLFRSLLVKNGQKDELVRKVGSREGIINSNGSKTDEKSELKLCPPIPPDLEGPVKLELVNVPSLEIQEKSHPELLLGGRFRPSDCQARHRVAIIIPFRDRAAHLAVFLHNIHPFLQRQQIDYAIYIVEQAGKEKFNRAMLLNIGSIEALKLYPYDCFIFHDVDLIPEDDRNLYTCPVQPRHMSVAINTMKYKLPYNDIFGGVSAMTVNQFKTVNGFSNMFWGWGGEDDDISNRIKFHGFYISRYPANIARYTMIHHKKDQPNPLRFKYLNEGKKRFKTDGLNNIGDKYRMLDIQFRKLYTWFNVEVKKT